ncbi:hypothetical protein PSHT_12208 [Puccinia striiformis]|uniref:Uncharacterized protein n=1 Tax=Puccinia striiformis TaxID=27350 RepID=A0A2S4UY96_9BASI|nr:hypothetical protein PSHT_12208 [Puccinia striiformis]
MLFFGEHCQTNTMKTMDHRDLFIALFQVEHAWSSSQELKEPVQSITLKQSNKTGASRINDLSTTTLEIESFSQERFDSNLVKVNQILGDQSYTPICDNVQKADQLLLSRLSHSPADAESLKEDPNQCQSFIQPKHPKNKIGTCSPTKAFDRASTSYKDAEIMVQKLVEFNTRATELNPTILRFDH